MNRGARLKERAAQAGREWAEALRVALQQEGRSAVGGWPGTLSEARVRALGLDQATILPADEHALLTSALYDAARRSWQSRRDPHVPDESDWG